jgi:hypothetical protein
MIARSRRRDGRVLGRPTATSERREVGTHGVHVRYPRVKRKMDQVALIILNTVHPTRSKAAHDICRARPVRGREVVTRPEQATRRV